MSTSSSTRNTPSRWKRLALLPLAGSRKVLPPFMYLVIAIIVIAVPGITPGLTVDLTSSNLPIVVIRTDGMSIPDEPKMSAWMGIIDKGPGQRNYPGDPFNGYEGPIGIETRGSSSQDFPKKSYGIETRDAAGANRNVSLLGMPPENDWVLYASYNDKSLMRNALAYWIAEQMGYHASRTRFCEVVLNGDYQGVYVLMERIKRDKNRIDIAELKTDDIAGDELTGGYIIRIDQPDPKIKGWYSAYVFGTSRVFYQYYYPGPTTIVPEQEAYIQNFIGVLEGTIAGDQFADPGRGYAQYLEVESFVDYLIVNEVAKNVDAYRLSLYMYKDRDSRGGKLVMRPVWDFDLAFGNVNYNVHPSVPVKGLFDQGLEINNGFVWFSSTFWFWWRRLLQDEAFREAVAERWRALRGDVLKTENLTAKIDEMANYLEEAQGRNFERWPVLGQYVWPNNFVGQTYGEEVAFLKEWLSERLSWMESNFLQDLRRVSDLAPDQLTAVEEYTDTTPPSFTLDQNYPNPFNGNTAIRFSLPVPTEVNLYIYNLAGQRVATLVREAMKAGEYITRWHGTDDRGNELASGIYLYRLETSTYEKTRELLLLK